MPNNLDAGTEVKKNWKVFTSGLYKDMLGFLLYEIMNIS
jgi:hypothetical protein